MLKLKDLQYLIAVEKYRHFGRAAESCFVSQPTLSGQLIKLEQRLGLPLFERHRKNVLLTYAGQQLIDKAHLVIRAAEAFESTACDLKDPLAGELHIGLIPTLAPYLLPHIIAPIKQALPQIKFFLYELQTQMLMERLDKGELDALILPWLDDMQGVKRFPLFDEPLVLMAQPTHQLMSKETLTLADLQGQEILSLEDGHCLRDQAMDYCFAAGASENNEFRATSLETLRHMVSTGMGITLMPKLAVRPGTDKTSEYRAFCAPQPCRNISLLIRPDYSRMACVDVLLNVISKAIQQAE